MQTWPASVLSKRLSLFTDYLAYAIVEADASVRAIARLDRNATQPRPGGRAHHPALVSFSRTAFWKFHANFPDEAERYAGFRPGAAAAAADALHFPC